MAKAASSPKKTDPKSQASKDLPLFYHKPVPLDVTRHATSGLMPVDDFSFAAHTNSIVINAVEFFEAAKHYPIVFTKSDKPMPVIMVGLEQDNYFIGLKGAWANDSYLPGYVRKYPFIFMENPGSEQFFLCIDEGAPQFKIAGSKGAMPLYNHSEASDLTKNALEFCGQYHNHNQLTRSFCDDVMALGLLTEMHSNVKLYNEREIHLGGFLSVDEKKLMSLPDDKVLELFKKGWLPLLYASLMSSSNWKKLADLAAIAEKAK